MGKIPDGGITGGNTSDKVEINKGGRRGFPPASRWAKPTVLYERIRKMDKDTDRGECDDGHGRLRRIVQNRKENNNYDEQSKERLRRNVETKIRTTMIGALSLLETKFGFLWGQGKPKGQLTDNELDMDQLKDELRTEILNNGNNQLRSALAEINQYTITWNKYQYDFRQKEGRNDD